MKFLVFTWFVLMVGVASNGFCDDKTVDSDSSHFDVELFVVSNYHMYYIDTTGPEPVISIIIETNGNLSQLDSLGIQIMSMWGDRTITSLIPVAIIPDIVGLESVLSIKYGRRIRPIAGLINNYQPRSAGMGVVSGKVWKQCIGRVIKISFLPLGQTVRNTILYDTLLLPGHEIEATTDSSGAFNVLLPAGVYQAKVEFVEQLKSDRLPSYVHNDDNACQEMIIDSITVRSGLLSRVTFDILHRDSSKETSSYIWIETFEPIK